MTDTTTIEPATVSVAHGMLIEETDAGLKGGSSGYCGGCGTWAAHRFTCAFCGYDFEGETASRASLD